MIKIDSILEVAKSFSAKATKDEAGVGTTIAQIKFSGLPVDRDCIDELLGMPVGWCRGALFDEQGAPLRRFGVSVYGRSLRVSGNISGPKRMPSLPLLQAELTDGSLTLVPLGAVFEGTLTWGARGDEVSDVSELLGKTCAAVWEITDGEQPDMFSATSKAAAQATTVVQRYMDGLGRMEGKQGGEEPGKAA
jgi:hypothetical protein